MSWVIAFRSLYTKFREENYSDFLTPAYYLRYQRVPKAVIRTVDRMGAFLDKPKTEKSNAVGEAHGSRYAVASMQGWRIDMEDAHVVEISMSTEPPFLNWSFYAVFDGHAGSKAAHHSAENLLKTLLATEQFTQVVEKLNQTGGTLDNKSLALLEKGIKSGFLTMDDKMRERINADIEAERSGTTAICAIVTPTHIVLANLGDSRAIISRKDSEPFNTEDHKPYFPKEKERIVKAGGSVMIQRVNGSLAVSRAFGDFEYKAVPDLSATEQLVSPEPDIYTLKRDPEKDEFLLLACDGVYDVMNNGELCAFVQSRMKVTDDLKSVANQVLDQCLSKGSRDNMTVILVCFEAAPKVDAKCVEEEENWKKRVASQVTYYLEEASRENCEESLTGKSEVYDVDRLMRMLTTTTAFQECPYGITNYATRLVVEGALQKYKSATESALSDINVEKN